MTFLLNPKTRMRVPMVNHGFIDHKRIPILAWMAVSLFSLGVVVSFARLASAEEARSGVASRTINLRIEPHWVDDQHFWFSRETLDRTSGEVRTEIVHFDAATGNFTIDGSNAHGIHAPTTTQLGGNFDARSGRGSDVDTEIEFVNESKQTTQLFWIDSTGRPKSYAKLKPGQSHHQHTYAGHAWRVMGDDGEFYGSIVASAAPSEALIQASFPRPAQRPSKIKRSSSAVKSDAWQKFAAIEKLIKRGVELRKPAYSPDGKVFIAWKFTPGENREVFRIESSPKGGGRAKLQSQVYPLPGDRLNHFELIACDTETGQRLATQLPIIDFGSPRWRWRGGHELLIEKVDRGHQRFRLFVVDPLGGSTNDSLDESARSSAIRTVIDEQSETFIWTSHTSRIRRVTYLDESDAVIYATERSGWRHLEWVDLSGVQPPRPITQGEFLVREILHVDEAKRTLDLVVGEYHKEQDPYHRHLIRVDFEGESLAVLTRNNGDHEAQFSPDRSFAVTTHSRVDLPPVHELVRTSDGKYMATLSAGERIGDDVSHPLPTVFRAKGRDGQTDIWGLICFPDDYDSESVKDSESPKKYPVIESIYAGPHGSHVPKQYRPSAWHRELTSLGFIVVQIDGMGTANRSKSFHDVCWHNLKDAGFPDRIAWMRAAAKAYPVMDLDRVGIYGTSAGGQNACGALLFHGDFYRAAMASCGCHDNRMDKASWNEQWMGYPVEDHYSDSSNIDNAHRLKGDLLLIVGELDSNVPPESTLRLVDALIQADKPFDFLMVPGLGHSSGGRYGRQKMLSFFVEKLGK